MKLSIRSLRALVVALLAASAAADESRAIAAAASQVAAHEHAIAALTALIASIRALDIGMTISGPEASAPTAATQALAWTAFETPGTRTVEPRRAIEAEVRGQGNVLLDAPPTAVERLANPRLARPDWDDDAYPAAMSSPEHKGVARAMAVMQAATDTSVPIVNADNNQYAPN